MHSKLYFIFVLISFSLSIQLRSQISCDPVWRYTNFGESPGLRSMQAADLNDDGIPEILVNSQGPLGWYIMNYDPADQEYKIIWTSPPVLGPAGITLLTLIDWDEDGDLEIFVSDSYANTIIYDGQTLEKIASFDLPTSAVRRVLFEDADNDGEKEIVVCSEHDAFIVNSTTLNTEFQFGMETRDIAVGQVDADPDLEIINADGDVFQLNGTTLITEWNAFDINSFYNIRHIELVQIDQDPALEIVIVYNTSIQVLDAGEQLVKYSTTNTSKITELMVFQTDAAATPKIYISDEGGSIYRFNTNLSQKTEIVDGWANNLDGICGFTITDSDNDGNLNFVFGEGCYSSGGEHIQVFNFNNGTFKWSHPDLDGPFSAIEYVEATGKLLAVSLATEGNYEPGMLVEIDPATGEELGLIPDIFSSYELFGMELVKLSSSQPEKLLLYGQVMAMLLDPVNYSVLKIYNANGGAYYSAAIADLNNDGTKEILLGNKSGVDIFNSNLQKTDYLLADFGSTTEVKTANIDADEDLEIIFANKYVHVFDDNFQLLWRSNEAAIIDIEVTDWNHDGVMDVIASDEYGNLFFYRLDNFEKFHTINIGNEDVNSVNITDLNEDGIDELLTVSNGVIYLIDTTSQAVPLSQNAPVSYYVRDFIEFEDLDDDGLKEIIFANNYSISAFSGDCYFEYLLTPSENVQANDLPLTLYPNPVSDMLYMTWNTPLDFTVQLMDATTQILFRADNTKQISMKALPDGIYFLRVIEKSTGHSSVQKVIKV